MIRNHKFSVGEKVYVETRDGKKEAVIVECHDDNKLIVELAYDHDTSNKRTRDISRLITYTRFVTRVR